MKAKLVKCLVALSAMLMALCVLAGCEKEKKTQPKGNFIPVKNVVVFTPRVVHCRVGDVINPDIYVDYEKITSPAKYNIKFKPCDPSVLSVTDNGDVTVLKRDSAYVTLYCENNGKVYKDTMMVFPGLPSGNDDYYIKSGYDLNNDKFMSDYEMSKVDVVNGWDQRDAMLLTNVKYVYSCPKTFEAVYDFSNNNKLNQITIGGEHSWAYHLQIILPNQPVLNKLRIDGDLGDYEIPELDLSHCPNLDTLYIKFCRMEECIITEQNHVRSLMLECIGLRKVDLSGCDDLTNIGVYPIHGGGKCILILSHNIYEKYKSLAPELTFKINDLVTVVEANK